MDCPHCAERLGLIALIRRTCGRCTRSLSARMPAAPELRRVLAARPLHLRWLLIGLGVTALVSLIPTLGALQLLVMTPVQLWCIEKATSEFNEHLPTRSMLIFDLASGMIFMALAAAGAVLGLLLESFSAPFAVLAFTGAFFGCRWVATTLATRAVENMGPGRMANVFLAMLGVLLMAPPVLLFLVVLNTNTLVGERSWSAESLLAVADLIVVGGVSSAELFVMPLWITALFAFFGIARISPEFGWVGSWWFLALATAFTLTEAVVDNALDRRRRFSRTTWPAIQRILSPLTLLFLVWVLSDGLPLIHRLSATFGAVITGDIFRRVTNQVKTATSFFPGASLAARRAQIHLIPKMILQAGLVAAVEHWVKPQGKIVILACGLLAAVCFLFATWMVRRAMRAEARVTCGCGTHIKRRARLCWKCQRPLANTLVLQQTHEARQATSAAALFLGVPASTLTDVGLSAVEPMDEALLRQRCSRLDGTAIRDLLAIVAAFECVDLPALTRLARALAGRRSTARMLLEEL